MVSVTYLERILSRQRFGVECVVQRWSWSYQLAKWNSVARTSHNWKWDGEPTEALRRAEAICGWKRKWSSWGDFNSPAVHAESSKKHNDSQSCAPTCEDFQAPAHPHAQVSSDTQRVELTIGARALDRTEIQTRRSLSRWCWVRRRRPRAVCNIILQKEVFNNATLKFMNHFVLSG